MTAFRVGVLNAQRGNQRTALLKARILAAHPRVLLVSEAQDLGTIPGYDRHGATGHATPEMRDCAIYVRRLKGKGHVEILDGGCEQGSKAVPGRPVQHDRWFVWVKAEINRDRYAFISYHGNAAIQRPDGTVPDSRGATESAELFRMIGALVTLLRSGGWTPIIGGDGNVWPCRWPYAPNNYWPTFGLDYRNDGIDGVAINRRALRFVWLKSLFAPGVDKPHRFILAKIHTR